MIDDIDIIKNIDPTNGVDISTVLPEIMPNRYYIFKSGGPHFFSKCKDKSLVQDIYLQNIWPFVYNIQGFTTKILTGSISKSKLTYPIIKLYHKSDVIEKRNFRKIQTIETTLRPREVEFGIHRLVGFAFVSNTNPETHTVLDHINGNRVDYRVSNLRWTTMKGNSKGSGGEKSDPDLVYKLISEQFWFQGMGSNNIKTSKDKHHEFILDKNNLKQLSFREEFERSLRNETKS